jgi:hypothetical protein
VIKPERMYRRVELKILTWYLTILRALLDVRMDIIKQYGVQTILVMFLRIEFDFKVLPLSRQVHDLALCCHLR